MAIQSMCQGLHTRFLCEDALILWDKGEVEDVQRVPMIALVVGVGMHARGFLGNSMV